MVDLVSAKRKEIEALCIQCGVRRLALFGSAAKSTFDPNSSDVDFLVEFGPPAKGERADVFFRLLEGLESLG